VAPSNPELPFHQPTAWSEPPSPPVMSFGHISGSSIIEGSQTDSEASFHTASLSDPDLPPSPTSAAQVDYNPEIEQTLDLSVVETLDFTNTVACVKFSRDGNYFAVAIDYDETHIYDVVKMSKT
jgi:hypothetical protein